MPDVQVAGGPAGARTHAGLARSMRKARVTAGNTFLPSRRALALAYAVTIVGYVVWSVAIPVAVLTTASHDDALFWRGAQHIVNGDWLGPYDNLTLAKGPGFPIVLAGNAVLGLPITLTLALLYLLACGAVTRQLFNVGLNRYASCVLFVLVLFHPGVVPSRVVRDDIYPSLTLLAVAGALQAVSAQRSGVRSALTTAGFGCALGLLWITREEGIWIVPGLVLLCAGGLAGARRDRDALRRRGTRVAVLFSAAAGVVLVVSTLNLAAYGKLMVTDFKDPAFGGALKALNGVQEGDDKPYVPVSHQKREAVYQISPTFAQLRADLEDPKNHWKNSSCAHYPPSCGDFAGGWWVWALRDAVAEAGHYSSPAEASRFYDDVSREVDRACGSGSVACRANPVPLMPNITAEEVRRIPGSLVAAAQVVTLQGAHIPTDPSMPPLADLNDVRRFLGDPVTRPAISERPAVVRGRFAAPVTTRIHLRCLGPDVGRSRPFTKELTGSRRVAGSGADGAPFSAEVPQFDRCSLRAADARSSSQPVTVPVAAAPQRVVLGHEAVVDVDSVSGVPQHLSPAMRLLTLLTTAYGLILPALVLAGSVALSGAVVLRGTRRHASSPLLLPALAMWLLVASRIAVLVLVDVTSFSAISALYMSAGFPLLVLAAGTSVQTLADMLRSRRSAPASRGTEPARRGE